MKERIKIINAGTQINKMLFVEMGTSSSSDLVLGGFGFIRYGCLLLPLSDAPYV